MVVEWTIRTNLLYGGLMIFKRDIEKTLKNYAKFPVVVLLGPRQSGKTTLVQEIFKKHTYVTLEDPEILEYVMQDPKRFLREYENDYGIIIDEFQHAPAILSYIQIESDAKDRPGYFVLTGSQNFLMNQAISQSLAGRAGILNLLPLSIHELVRNEIFPKTSDELIFNGSYPRMYAKNFTPQELFPSYIRTYVERDVRQLVNVDNILAFQKFMRLCAGRVGQQLNVNEIAAAASINRKTADKWIGILEASYILFLLKPHFNNYNKRVTKTPKLYFYDTGLACSLLGLRSTKELSLSSFRGALFENVVIADFYKQYYNAGIEPSAYYWRDQNGRLEVDCIIDNVSQLIPVEIKSGETIVSDFFSGIEGWSSIVNQDPSYGYIVYAGGLSQTRSLGKVITLKVAGQLIASLESQR